MKFSDMEMKELGRSTWNDTHNITSLIRTPQVCLRHLADGRSLHGGRVQTHTHIHAHTPTRKYYFQKFMENVFINKWKIVWRI